MLGTELGLAEPRLLMRKLRSRIQAMTPVPVIPPEPPAPSKKDVVLAVLGETGGNAKAAIRRLADRGVRGPVVRLRAGAGERHARAGVVISPEDYAPARRLDQELSGRYTRPGLRETAVREALATSGGDHECCLDDRLDRGLRLI
jgi:hypothetical protein